MFVVLTKTIIFLLFWSIQYFYLFTFLKNWENSTIVNNGLAVIYLNINIYIYIIYILFALLFLLDTKKLKTLSDLKIFSKLNLVTYTAITTILSIGGIPPFLGFAGKFLIFCIILIKQKQLFLYMFSFFNFFSIYFYIQNLRFMVGKTITTFFLKNGFFQNFSCKLVNVIVFFNFFNFFGIFFVEDIYCIYLFSFFCKNIF